MTIHQIFFLSHHAVFKEGSMTTKTRVVFDSSAEGTTGISLNDMLMVGPTIQQDLVSIVLRFQMHVCNDCRYIQNVPTHPSAS
jgi:hypothetical protein